MNRQRRLPVLAGIAMALPIAATATPVTYEFTGTVYGAGNALAQTLGSTVTGTYTIDYSLGDPRVSFGTLGSNAQWQVDNASSQGALVFSSTVVFHSALEPFTYTTPSDGRLVQGGVQGGVDGSGLSYLIAGESSVDASLSPVESSFSISAQNPGTSVFTTAGSLQFDPAIDSALGEVDIGHNSTALFQITDIHPVPLPATAWLLLSGMLSFAPRICRHLRSVAAPQNS